MAEKDITGMQSRDFLGDLTKNVTKSTGVGLYEKLAANARQQATEPLRKIANTQAFLQPINALITKAETAQKAGLAAYIAANPDIDESKLYDGTGDMVNSIMQENNRRFREINKRLSFMNINNPEYQTLVNEINNINKTSAQLRADNEKLLNIRNMMRDDNKVELLSNGMSSSQLKMYEDIQVGNKENFVNINGKLHWQDPNDLDAEPIAISSIDAGGPTYQNSLVMEKTTELYSNVIDAAVIDDRLLYSKINNLWKIEGIGNSGLKSFIFDNQDASDIAGFATSDWFESWYRDQGITDEAEKLKEYDRIRNQGVLADGNKGNVKQHFSAWYHSKLKEVAGTQYNKQQQLKKSNLNLNAFEEEETTQTQSDYDAKVDTAFAQGDETSAISYLKNNNLIPSGITIVEANIFDNEVFKITGDTLGIFTDDSFKSENKRFSLGNEKDKKTFKEYMQAYQQILDKNFPDDIDPPIDNLTALEQFDALLAYNKK